MSETATVSMIQISKKTLDILKNFASINSNILVKQGNVLSTVSPMKNLMGKAEIEETFDVEFGIWDLNKFLGTISLFTNPYLTFEDNRVVISNESNTSQVVYYYSEPSLLTTPPRDVTMPDPVLSFDISEAELAELQKASATLQLPDLKIVNSQANDDGVYLLLTDKNDPTSNTYTVEVSSGIRNKSVDSYSFHIKMDSLKILPGSYSVEISDKLISHFSSENDDIEYWVALASDSVVGR